MKLSRSILVSMVLTVMAASAVFFAPAATASFHATRITEVYAGSTAVPKSQFIELRMLQAGQNLVNGIKVTVFDASGTESATFTFTSNVVNGQSQAAILLATQEAQQEFGVTADLTITPAMAASGGKVCFDSIDCVSWGNYSGGTSGTGAPAAPGGIPSGFSLTRNTAGGTSPGLDSGDDTNDSSADFQIASPTPTNNLGTTGGSNPGPTPTPTPTITPTPTPTPPTEPADHARSVSLRKRADRLVGKVMVEDGFEACASDVPLKLQRRTSSMWKTVAARRSGATGRFSFATPNRTGRYRTSAPSVNFSDDTCTSATSSSVRI